VFGGDRVRMGRVVRRVLEGRVTGGSSSYSSVVLVNIGHGVSTKQQEKMSNGENDNDVRTKRRKCRALY
jgi:hypothetical protein